MSIDPRQHCPKTDPQQDSKRNNERLHRIGFAPRTGAGSLRVPRLGIDHSLARLAETSHSLDLASDTGYQPQGPRRKRSASPQAFRSSRDHNWARSNLRYLYIRRYHLGAPRASHVSSCTNGTRLNGQAVTTATVLTNDDEIACGTTTLVVDIAAQVSDASNSNTQRITE
jgi:hypothetical protein